MSTDPSPDCELQAAQAEIAELQQQVAELMMQKDDLERQVDERTAALHDARTELLRGERMSALGQLTATVSHELRNPLGALRTSLFMIQNKTKDKDLGVERALGRADRSIDRCDHIITDMLDYARTSDVQAKMGNIDSWLDSVLEEQKIPEGVEIRRDARNPEMVVPFDGDRLRRAIINSYDNACHAMADEESGKERQLTIKSALNGMRFEISITDTGCGMDDATLDKIFEPLFSTKSYGVGLGMPTIKQTMEQHGGGVELTSTPGFGTTVVLWLPTEAAAAA